MRGKQALHEGVIVFIRIIGSGRIGAGILQDAMDLRHVLRRECHVPASHQITLLTMACRCPIILAGEGGVAHVGSSSWPALRYMKP